MPEDFAEDIRRLVLESIGSIALNTRLGLLGENRESAEAKQLIDALAEIIELSFYLDMMPALWKYLPVPSFKKLMNSLDTITDICHGHIQQALQRIEREKQAGQGSTGDQERSVLEKLLQVDHKTAVIMAMDLFFAGADPVSSQATPSWRLIPAPPSICRPWSR